MDLSELSEWIRELLEQPDVLPSDTDALYVAESSVKETGVAAQAFAVTPTLLVALDLESEGQRAPEDEAVGSVTYRQAINGGETRMAT